MSDPAKLTEPLRGTLTGSELVLGPALRCTLERAWCDDDPQRTTTWRWVVGVAVVDGIDPVLASKVIGAAVR